MTEEETCTEILQVLYHWGGAFPKGYTLIDFQIIFSCGAKIAGKKMRLLGGNGYIKYHNSRLAVDSCGHNKNAPYYKLTNKAKEALL